MLHADPATRGRERLLQLRRRRPTEVLHRRSLVVRPISNLGQGVAGAAEELLLDADGHVQPGAGVRVWQAGAGGDQVWAGVLQKGASLLVDAEGHVQHGAVVRI